MARMRFIIAIVLCCAVPALKLQAQDIQIFTLKDFELKGHVQICEVRTDYGKEIFSFDREGRLIRSETLYGESDKNVTTYEYADGELSKKRIEHISGGKLDRSQSFYYSYRTQYDESGAKVVEDILSYDSQLRERHVFEYDTLGKLDRIAKSHQQGLDEIRIARSKSGDTAIVQYQLNQEIQRIEKTYPGRQENKVVTFKVQTEYFQGVPYERTFEITGEKGRRMEATKSFYQEETGSFVQDEQHRYLYDDKGALKAEIIRKGSTVTEKGYIFQYDDHTPPNWIRKIQTPDNTFVSRLITYFPERDTHIRDKQDR